MTAVDDARFRLQMAERGLDKAREQVGLASWREATMFARGAVELAAKATASCFAAVPKTHDAQPLLTAVIADPRFPPGRLAAARALLPVLKDYGLARHIQLAYGDEAKHVLPWDLVTEQEAREAASHAAQMVDLARGVISDLFAP